MKIFNILFNYKKGAHDKKVLGVERCFIDYTKYLTLKGNQVISVNKPNMVYADDVRACGDKYYEINALGRADILSMFSMSRLFKKHGIDVAICHSGRALFFTRAARFICRKNFPIIAIDHGINPNKFIKADYILAVNSFFSKKLIEAGKSPDRATNIPNMMKVPQDFEKLNKKPFRKIIRLGSLGRLYPEKFFDKVIKAIALLKEEGIDCYYQIGGVGPMEEKLNNLANELGVADNFKILGWTEDKKSFFEDIDIFILPSFGETFGIVLLEAMLYSTPIITSNSWGPDEVITEGFNGLKVSKDDAENMPKLLARAIKQYINDEQKAKEIAENAYNDFFKNYTTEVVIEKLNNICKEAIRLGVDK